MFSVDDEEEARTLITLACERNAHGEPIARELAFEQTLDNLARFSHRLAVTHDYMIARGTCRCATGKDPAP